MSRKKCGGAAVNEKSGLTYGDLVSDALTHP